MRNYSVFDILGPVMIGPSSSHTAGAARLGKVAGIIAGGKIRKVEFYLHGSFAKTYRGHGTDRALVAGILGMDPWDEKLRNSIEIAGQTGLEICFYEADLGAYKHPNTVKFVITKDNNEIVEVMGSSVGGGSISISEVDGEPVKFTGEYPTLIIKHLDVPGVVSKVTAVMYKENINIAFMKVYRSSKGQEATMVFETDTVVPDEIVDKISDLGDISSIRVVAPVSED